MINHNLYNVVVTYDQHLHIECLPVTHFSSERRVVQPKRLPEIRNFLHLLPPYDCSMVHDTYSHALARTAAAQIADATGTPCTYATQQHTLHATQQALTPCRRRPLTPWAMYYFGTCKKLEFCHTKTPNSAGEQTPTSTTWWVHPVSDTVEPLHDHLLLPLLSRLDMPGTQVAALRTLGLDVQQLQRSLKREVCTLMDEHLLSTAHTHTHMSVSRRLLLRLQCQIIQLHRAHHCPPHLLPKTNSHPLQYHHSSQPFQTLIRMLFCCCSGCCMLVTTHEA